MKTCVRCGRELRAEFQLGATCHNTEACKRRALAKIAESISGLNLRVKPAKTYLPNPHTQKL